MDMIHCIYVYIHVTVMIREGKQSQFGRLDAFVYNKHTLMEDILAEKETHREIYRSSPLHRVLR